MFAIKVILNKDAKVLKEVEREVAMMQKLKHERLVTLYEAYECTGSYGMLMDYVGGGELFERIIEKEYLEEQEAVMYLRQVLEGLQYMHGMNIVHLDIKPENILCIDARSNRIKLIDFGLARELKPGEITRCALGTPDFVAPEAISFNEIKLQTDMWSTGVLTYVLLSGLMPFGSDTDTQTLCNIANVDWDFDEYSFEEISSDAQDFIRMLLTFRPEDRLSSSEALEHAWMRRNEERGGKINTKRHRTFLARRRWKKSVHVVVAVSKLCRLRPFSSTARVGHRTVVHTDESSPEVLVSSNANQHSDHNSVFRTAPQPDPDSTRNSNIAPKLISNLEPEPKHNHEASPGLILKLSAEESVPITPVNQSTKIQMARCDLNDNEYNSVAMRVQTQTNDEDETQNGLDSSNLVRNRTFLAPNKESGEKIMWKVLK